VVGCAAWVGALVGVLDGLQAANTKAAINAMLNTNQILFFISCSS
jgi:hypothetical protein